LAPKLVAMATVLKLSEKRVRSSFPSNIYHLVKKIVKIGPVDPKIGLPIKKRKSKKLTQAKKHRPLGRHSEWAKQPCSC